MGRIVEYVVLLSNLSLVLSIQQYKELVQDNKYEKEKQENFTQVIKQYFPKEQNEFFHKKVLPLDFQVQRRPPSKPNQMRTSLGLHAFASDNPQWKGHKRNSSYPNTGYSNPSRRNAAPTFSQALYPKRNSKNSWSVDFQSEIPYQRLSKLNNPNVSLNQQNRRPEDATKRFHKEGRNARYHSRHAAKICDPCNNVPWVPLLKVPESYRQQRTHVTKLFPTPQQSFNFDYHAFASNTHNVLVPPVPLIPPLEPIYDGTISSSFGLPIGNIPTSHGLLAPINHLGTKVNKYTANTIDYNSFSYFAPQSLLDSHRFPELSPVPVVPIHDSEQFYQFDSSVPDLVPPPTKTVDVSNVVLSISEDNSAKLEPPKPEVFHSHKPKNDLNSESSAVDSQGSHTQTKEESQNKNFGKLEIVKSIPLAEFTSFVDYPHQELPLYPPLQSEFSAASNELHSSTSTDHSNSSFNFLVPPVKSQTDFGFSSNKSDHSSHSTSFAKSELEIISSVPKPLTSSSLSWLFSDHTAPPSDSKSTASVSSFVADAQEIASVVNNELRPVSSHPLPASTSSPQNVGNSKSKKIQIIIPYTTKNKSRQDNNALESSHHEVFQPPVSKSTSETKSLRDFATSVVPPVTYPSKTNPDTKPDDGLENKFKTENQQPDEDRNHKYLSEMHHIIASNIRELLREEIDKSQSDQNYPLQNNIDNWTALEYSNHKIVETKAPKEIITHALAVTSIPGTSISHLLLPSKKIPNEYFITTPLPVYDEPTNSLYKAANSTVNSSPFTAKSYATTSVYNPGRVLKENVRQTTEGTSVSHQGNHEKNYTEVGRGKVNNWGKLNENLVLPAARSKVRSTEPTTTSGWTNSIYASSGSEKVQIVTPVSLTNQRNYTATVFRRTTRQTHSVESPTTESFNRKPFILNKLNSTRLQKVSNQTSPLNRKFTYNSTSHQLTNSSKSVLRVERTNISVSTGKNDVKTNETISSKNLNRDEVELPSKNEHLSINDIFPFRNKELPWESNLNSSQQILRVGRQRKSLIKQVNLPRPKAAGGTS